MQGMEFSLESTRLNETVCLMLAAGLHVMMIFWNPVVLKSNWHPPHDFVTVDVVDQTPAAEVPAPPAKMSLMDTLKDMMNTSKQSIAHMAPVAIIKQVMPFSHAPLLKEASRPRFIPTVSPLTSQSDQLATTSPEQIAMQSRQNTTIAGQPQLKAKNYSGVRASDLPFQLSNSADQSLAGSAASIPIALGNNSAKSTLGYVAPVLKDTGKHGPSLRDLGARSQTGEMAALSGSAAQSAQIALAGTGTSAQAPINSAPSLQQRQGGGGSFVNTALLGNRSGGSAYSAPLNTLPSQAAGANNAPILQNTARQNQQAAAKKAFDISGPLHDRPIVHKEIPVYPSWAEEQGIVGTVSYYFTVTSEGTVRQDITLKQTTGYPELDKLALDSLRRWKFQPLPEGTESSGQWGIITFNFALTS